METIGNSNLWTLMDGFDTAISRISNQKIRRHPGHYVQSYLELARKISELQFRNREYVFLFRGQSRDYMDRRDESTLRPSILRSGSPKDKFEKLKRAEKLLIDMYRLTGSDRIKRHQALRWALLQHYGVCDTPLLDVTQSLRIAASFASDSDASMAYVFVLAVPNISGAITASDEAGIEIIRLSSVCPPEAVRPHIQEGYLLSEYPEISSIDQHSNYDGHELDFGKRIIAKFRFSPETFWGANTAFPRIPREALYPNAPHDPVLDIANHIRSVL